MNLPNKLTLLRVALIPLCIILVLAGWRLPAAIIFILAALTDFLDGYIARKQKIVTNFGKFADPVADKILSLSMMIVLIPTMGFPWWGAAIVAARELAIDGLRLVAVEQGVVIPAGKLGKIKTNVQFLSILSSLLSWASWLTQTLTIIMSILTIVSGLEYFLGSRQLFSTTEQNQPEAK